MRESDLYEASDTLLDYLQGYREDIKVKVRFQQEEKEVFNVKETLHMVDVKNLYQSALLIRNIMLVFMGILFTLLYYDDKKGVKSVLTYTYQRFFVFFALFLGDLLHTRLVTLQLSGHFFINYYLEIICGCWTR